MKIANSPEYAKATGADTIPTPTRPRQLDFRHQEGEANKTVELDDDIPF
jgi:hypothetical protein